MFLALAGYFGLLICCLFVIIKQISSYLFVVLFIRFSIYRKRNIVLRLSL